MRARALAFQSERRRRGFVFAAMHSPFTWPVLGGSLIAAVAFGIHLGESSIGLINPIYFQAPPRQPRERGAAIDESTLQQRAPDPYAGLYGWEQGQTALAADCGDCAVHYRDNSNYSARVPYFGSSGDLHRVVVHARQELGDDFPEAPQDLSWRDRDIERYAYYPVTVDEPKPRLETVAHDEPEAAPLSVGKDYQE